MRTFHQQVVEFGKVPYTSRGSGQLLAAYLVKLNTDFQ